MFKSKERESINESILVLLRIIEINPPDDVRIVTYEKIKKLIDKL